MPNTNGSVQISFDNGESFESLIVTQLGVNEYRLEEIPLLSEPIASYGDVIEAEKNENDCLIFHRITSKANFQIFQNLISRQLIEAPQFKRFCESVMQFGGMWELAFGGIFIVHVPNGVEFDVSIELEKISQDIK